MKNIFRVLSGVAAAFVLAFGITVGIAEQTLPDSFRVVEGQELDLQTLGFSIELVMENEVDVISMKHPTGKYDADVLLFNTIPIKTVHVDVTEPLMLVPCGTPFGIKMFTNGVVVVGMSDIDSETGKVNPAEQSGLKIGDIITNVNGETVYENEEISKVIQDYNGEPLVLTVKRDTEILEISLNPVKSSQDGSYKGGLWVRDSTAGIGTVTFYNPENGLFGGLGHGICDIDTNSLMPMKNGDIVPVTISGVTKGQKGAAGELRGYFSSNQAIGNLFMNSDEGVYGQLEASPVEQQALPVAMKQEVKEGPAQILTTVADGEPQYYNVTIESIEYKNSSRVKNLVVLVTDKALLEKTGGIVQGISGSPIIQNGKIVGAVTHVFLNDPTRGYGIFAENMVENLVSIERETVQKAS